MSSAEPQTQFSRTHSRTKKNKTLTGVTCNILYLFTIEMNHILDDETSTDDAFRTLAFVLSKNND